MTAKLWSLQAEREVIGGMLVAPERIDEVLALVGYRDFGHVKHRLFVWAITELTQRGATVDVVTVSTLLEDAKRLDPTDLADLAALVMGTASAANVVTHARLVRDFARRRKLAALGTKLVEWAGDTSDPEQIVSRLQGAVQALESQVATEGPRRIGDILPDVWAELQRRQDAKGQIMGVPIGIPGIDEILDGLNPGLYIFAARPAMGKSVLALQAAHAVAALGIPALFFTLEMNAAQKAHRLLSATAPADYGRLQSARLHEDEWERVTDAGVRLGELPLWIDDAASLRLDVLISRARRLHRASPLGLIVVDYLQLVTADGDGRVQEVGAISRGLKMLSGELKVPVIGVSQLNRKLEERGNKRPIMSDLRESGSLEQDADVIAFLYRDEVYDEQSADLGFAEFLVSKNRFGAPGMVPLRFFGAECRFAGATTLPSRVSGGSGKQPDYAVVPIRKGQRP